MCWISPTQPIAEEASKDIPIFKICEFDTGGIRSRVFGFPYTLNKVYTMPPPKPKWESFGWIIARGFHAYADNCIVKEHFKNIFEVRSSSDTCNSRQLCTFNQSFSIIVTGYIPKGAIYFKNDLGEIVASHIVLTEIKN